MTMRLLIPLLTDNSVFTHPGAKRAWVETKKYCCPVLALYPPIGILERTEDVVVFQIGECFNVLNFKPPNLAERVELVQYLQ